MSRERIRILYLTQGFASRDKEHMFLDIVFHLDRKNFKPIVILPEPSSVGQILEENDATVYYLPLPVLNWLWKPREWFTFLARYRESLADIIELIQDERIDILQASDVASLSYLSKANEEIMLPLIWHVTEMFTPSFFNRNVMSKADRVVCLSEAIKKSLPENNEKVRVIHGGMDMREHQLKGSDFRSSWDLNEGERVIGMSAPFKPEYRHREFIRAAGIIVKSHPETRFLLVIDERKEHDPWYRLELQQLADQVGVSHKIIWQPNRGRMLPLYRSLDVFVHLAEKDPFPRVVLELMSLPKPVVALKGTVADEIIEDASDGMLVDRPTPEGIAETVGKILSDPDCGAFLARAARRKILTQFSLAQTLRKTEKSYLELNQNSEEP